MMMKSGLEKILLKFLHAGDNFPLLRKIPKITNLVTKLTIFLRGGISKQIFLHHFSSSFLGRKY